MNRIYSLTLVLVFTLGFLASDTGAQINGPTPTLMGQSSSHLYSVPGVIHNGPLGTFFACTNTTSANIRVGVEIFDFSGGAANDPSATSLDIPPGGTRLFGTSGAVSLSVFGDLSPGFISNGSARVLATAGSGIICSAFLADPGNAPPTTMANLTIVKKTKQKGD